MGDLVLTLIQGAEFYEPKAKKKTPANAYIEVRIVGDYGGIKKTPVQPKTSAPKWDIQYKYKLRKKNVSVRIEAFHSGFWRNSSLGHVEARIETLTPGYPGEIWLNTSGQPKIHARFLWNPDHQYQTQLNQSKASQYSGDTLENSIMQGGARLTKDLNQSVDSSTSTGVRVTSQPNNYPPQHPSNPPPYATHQQYASYPNQQPHYPHQTQGSGYPPQQPQQYSSNPQQGNYPPQHASYPPYQSNQPPHYAPHQMQGAGYPPQQPQQNPSNPPGYNPEHQPQAPDLYPLHPPDETTVKTLQVEKNDRVYPQL